ncbi:hypothetical protein DPMN_000197 [Dreissena polymorpha]|uniref:Uncharacterized protein n=1 Tax=Dreissena polymorpha TaxID=45954 RepID=A0A9D4MJA2_DREPO|nr:hypothetical protein DPMN_000197 [Dreissena polymorpha]
MAYMASAQTQLNWGSIANRDSAQTGARTQAPSRIRGTNCDKTAGLEEFFQSQSPCRASRPDNFLAFHFNLLALH